MNFDVAVQSVQDVAPASRFVDAPQDDASWPSESVRDPAGVVPVLQPPLATAVVTPAQDASPAVRSVEAPPPSRFDDAPPPSRFDEAPPPSRFVEAPPSRFIEAPPPSRFVIAPPDSADWPLERAPDAAGVVPLLQSLFATMPAPPPEDVAFFTREAARVSVVPTQLDQLAVDLAEIIEAGRIGRSERCTFDLDVPGWGRLEGHISIQDGEADVELHALRPGAAAALRSRLHDLQRMVDSESGGDVNLIIV